MTDDVDPVKLGSEEGQAVQNAGRRPAHDGVTQLEPVRHGEHLHEVAFFGICRGPVLTEDVPADVNAVQCAARQVTPEFGLTAAGAEQLRPGEELRLRPCEVHVSTIADRQAATSHSHRICG